MCTLPTRYFEEMETLCRLCEWLRIMGGCSEAIWHQLHIRLPPGWTSAWPFITHGLPSLSKHPRFPGLRLLQLPRRVCSAIGGVGSGCDPRSHGPRQSTGLQVPFQRESVGVVGAVCRDGSAGVSRIERACLAAWACSVQAAKQIFFFAARPCRLRVGILIKLTPHPSTVPKNPVLA